MKMSHLMRLTVILLTTVMLSGCQNYREGWTPYDPLALVEVRSDTDAVVPAPDTPSERIPFQIWGETDTTSLDAFKQMHPELDVQYRTQDPVNWEAQWISALSAGAGPDIFVYAAERAGWAALLDVFEDLSDASYSLNSLKPLLSDAEWAETESLDRKKRVYLPLYTYPGMLFYRADILEENGFPSEPEALADYLASPGLWLDMARTLHDNGHAMMEWKESPWNAGGFVSAPFTADLTWRMGDNRYSQILQTSVTATRENLVGNINVWDASDREALRSGQQVMVQMGAWGVDLLPEWLPEQSGAWRVTRLPMGLSTEWGTRWMSMNKDSENKALSWELMALTTRSVRSYYTDLRSKAYTYFGEQQVFALADQMRLEMDPLVRTPLDRQITDLFWNQLYLVYDGNMPASDYLLYIDQEIESRFASELSAFRKMHEPIEESR